MLATRPSLLVATRLAWYFILMHSHTDFSWLLLVTQKVEVRDLILILALLSLFMAFLRRWWLAQTVSCPLQKKVWNVDWQVLVIDWRHLRMDIVDCVLCLRLEWIQGERTRLSLLLFSICLAIIWPLRLFLLWWGEWLRSATFGKDFSRQAHLGAQNRLLEFRRPTVTEEFVR